MRVTRTGASDDGFTLFEALVALAVMSTALAAIGQLGYSSLAAARRTQTRLGLTSAVRTALAALPDRRNSRDVAVSGKILNDRWRLVAAPYLSVPSDGPINSGWSPQVLELQVIDPSGGSIVVETVRLRRNSR